MLHLIPDINDEAAFSEGTFIMPKAVVMDGTFHSANKVFLERLARLGDYKPGDGAEPVIACVKADLGEEGYRLEVKPDKVVISASGEKGYSNGLVSLYQLLAKGNGRIGCCSFTDTPKYPRRGFMLDVCRHFFPAEEVKKIIEQCSLLKLNYFHWHLSDDQGFRIESKKFPELNKISSYRRLSEIDPVVTEGLGKTGDIYGGYYTRNDIREIIEFAAARQIEVIPEIDLPGHTTAIHAAHPEYTCSGEKLEVANTFGIFPRIFCAGKEEGYNFLFDLLDEICELFPSKYFHIGGDEAPKSEWKACPECNRVMKEHGFTGYEQLQAYFGGRLIDYLKKKGKTAIVWNEAAASGELDDSAVIHYWIEMGGGASYVVPELAKGRKLILSSMNQFYFDYSYADIPMKATLLYEPEIKGTPVPGENVLGVEAPMWTEWISTCKALERMIYPRMHALAECAWTKDRNFEDFICRLKEYLQIEPLNILKGMPWEEATIHGQAALDMIVERMKELSVRYSSMRQEGGETAEAFVPEGTEQVKVDPMDAMKAFIYEKMKAAYTDEEIKYVQDRLLR